MKRKRLEILLATMCLVLAMGIAAFTGACAKPAPVPTPPPTPAPTPTPHEPYSIEIYSLPTGSSFNCLGVGLAELINKNSSWLTATSLEGRGGTVNMRIMAEDAEKAKHILVLSSPMSAWQVANMPIYEEPYTTCKNVALIGFVSNVWGTLDPNIKTVKDFEGKRIAIGEARHWARSKQFELLISNELDLDKIAKIERLPMSAQADALRDGLVDVSTISTAISQVSPKKHAASPAFLELLETKDVYFISMDPADFDAVKAMEKYKGIPVEPTTIPAGNFGPTQPEPIISESSYVTWMVDIAMPDDVVYEIVRVMYENADKFVDYHIVGKVLTKETLCKMGSEVTEKDVHPGAFKFYKDQDCKLGKL